MVELLERQVELQEEQNELLRENSQLLGDVLNSLETLSNQPPAIVNVGPGGQHIDTNIDAPHTTTSVKNILTEQKGPVPTPDQEALKQAVFGGLDPLNASLVGWDISFFWPKAKAPQGWLRASVKHADEASWKARVADGCLCGKPIVLKEHNGDTFYSCEALTQKGSCNYRPAAYADKLTFLTNLPPSK